MGFQWAASFSAISGRASIREWAPRMHSCNGRLCRGCRLFRPPFHPRAPRRTFHPAPPAGPTEGMRLLPWDLPLVAMADGVGGEGDGGCDTRFAAARRESTLDFRIWALDSARGAACQRRLEARVGIGLSSRVGTGLKSLVFLGTQAGFGLIGHYHFTTLALLSLAVSLAVTSHQPMTPNNSNSGWRNGRSSEENALRTKVSALERTS